MTIAAEIRQLIARLGRAVGVFDSAPSLGEIFDELANTAGIEWTRVIGFHLDEVLGVKEDSPESSRNFLLARLVRRIPMAEFHGLRGEAANPEAVCVNYTALLKSRPPDFALLELKERGRLASISAPECDFNDPAQVKTVGINGPADQRLPLDRSPGGSGKFKDGRLPAISLTIPAIMACPKLFVIAPDATKQEAARVILESPIATTFPASILRTHKDAHLFLIQDAVPYK